MKIIILSRSANYYSTKRLVQEAKHPRHQALVIDPLDCHLSVKEGVFAVYALSGKFDLSGFDVVIPRLGIIGVDYGLLVVRQFELMENYVLNSSQSLSNAKNKFFALQVLAKAGLPIPQTMMVHNLQNIKEVVKKLGGLPVVLKLFRGSQGKGVILSENLSSLESILTAVWAIGYDIILQKYYPETRGEDIRILVLGDKIIGAMRRIPKKGEFRSNIHQGGKMKKVNLSHEEKDLAIRAVRVLGLNLAGVDIMRTSKGTLILEVNGSPGFEGLEKITGANIARQIIDFATSV
jgi:ribosomal protein S6--L-glutamate ligase